MNPFVIPIEIKVRELDAKLLLALAACERGARVVIGDQRETRLYAPAAAAGTMLAKSINSGNPAFHQGLRDGGMRVMALDEEGLIYPSWSQYLKLNAPREGILTVDRCLVWGDEQASRMRETYGDTGVPIVTTGNPRFDLLRPELRAFYDAARDRLRQTHGDFILVNTSFGAVVDVAGPDGMVNLLQRMGAVRTPEEIDYYRDYVEYSARLVRSFVELMTVLDREAGCRIILRPHPAEDLRFWRRATRALRNVAVIQDGPAAAWVYASRALVQKGCTTAIEALALGIPAVTYEAERSERHDLMLPRALSRIAGDPGEVLRAVRVPEPAPPEARALAGRYIANLDGPFAADRIADTAMSLDAGGAPGLPAPGLFRRERWTRKAKKPFRRILPGYRESYIREVAADHKFPGLSSAEVHERIARFQALTGRFGGIRARPVPGTRTLHELAHAR